jgi:hypothetical protein
VPRELPPLSINHSRYVSNITAINHERKPMNHRNIVRLSAIAPVLAVSLLPSAATANDTSTLWLKNIDQSPVTMTLSTENSNCYEGQPQLGEVWENVAPGAQVKMLLSRVQGHGCNGHQGEFEISFDPGVGVKKIQHFDFDNGGELELTPRPNTYPGALTKTGDKVFTYTTFQTAAVTVVGAAVGSWKLICQQICSRTLTEQRTKDHTTSTKLTSEVTTKIAATLEAGVEMEGVGGVKTSIETSQEKKIGHEMAESFSNGETNIDTSSYEFTPEQMKSFNIFAIWQWVATTKLSDGQQVMLGSNKFTCAPDAATPDYYPGSPKDLKACRGG